MNERTNDWTKTEWENKVDWSKDVCEFEHGNKLNPWGESFPVNFKFHEVKGRDGEVTHWKGSMMVNGKLNNFTLWND